MMTDTLTFLLLLFALSSYSDGLCIRQSTMEYEKYLRGLENTVKDCPEACNNNPEYPCCQPLNISEPCNCSYFKTGLSQMKNLKEATKHCKQLERRLKCCPSSLKFDDLQCKHLVSQKEFVEELGVLFKQLNNLRSIGKTTSSS